MLKKKPKKSNIKDLLHLAFIPSYRNAHRPHAFRHFMLSIYSVALILSHLSFGVVQYTPLTTNPEQLKDNIMTKINTERQKKHESILQENLLLDRAAEEKLNDMFEKNYWDHTSPNGEKAWSFINQTGYSYTSAGENLARGFISAESMVKAWMNSETHRNNILNQDFTETGIAVGNGIIGGKETTVAVQLFGAPSATFAQNSSLVAGEKSISPSFSLSNPLASSRIPYFVIYLLIFGLIIFDGVMIHINKTHKNKKHMFAFRTSLSLSAVALLVLCISLVQVW